MNHTLATIGAAAAVGLLSAGWVRGQAFVHSVPPDQPWRTACPHCATTLITSRHAWAWLPRAHCPHCAHRIGPPPASVELVLVVVLSLLASAITDPLALIAATVVAITGTTLACIDIAVHRLPDRLTLPTFLATALLLAADAAMHGRTGHALTALAGAAASTSIYLMLALARGGLGDAKLALTTGLLLGWYGWPALVAGTTGALALTAVCGAVLRLTGRLPPRAQLPHGPAILTTTLAVLLTAGHH